MSCIVFPTYQRGVKPELKRLQTGHALHRLAEAGYDLQNHMDRDLVSNLIEWLSVIPSYELRYGDLDRCVETLLDLDDTPR